MTAHFVAAAAPADAIDTQVSRQVVLTAATANGEQMNGLEAAVRDAVASAGLLVVASRVARIDLFDVLNAGPPGTAAPDQALPVARLWIEAAAGSPASLYLTDGARRRVYVRQVPLEGGQLDRVALESIALVVGSSVNALVAGREIGVSREAFAQSVVAVPVAPSAPARPATPATPTPRPGEASRVRSASLLVGYEIVREAPIPYQHRLAVEYQSSWSRARAALGVISVTASREVKCESLELSRTNCGATRHRRVPGRPNFDCDIPSDHCYGLGNGEMTDGSTGH